MKRNCKGCRAFESYDDSCDLGYKIGHDKIVRGVAFGWKPLEKCPKPKTYDEYFKELANHKIKRG